MALSLFTHTPRQLLDNIMAALSLSLSLSKAHNWSSFLCVRSQVRSKMYTIGSDPHLAVVPGSVHYQLELSYFWV
jgi:hypothetical protein